MKDADEHFQAIVSTAENQVYATEVVVGLR